MGGIISLNQTYDETLNVDKLKDEWKHHSPYFWLERMTFLAAFGFDIPEAGLKISMSHRLCAVGESKLIQKVKCW